MHLASGLGPLFSPEDTLVNSPPEERNIMSRRRADASQRQRDGPHHNMRTFASASWQPPPSTPHRRRPYYFKPLVSISLLDKLAVAPKSSTFERTFIEIVNPLRPGGKSGAEKIRFLVEVVIASVGSSVGSASSSLLRHHPLCLASASSPQHRHY